MTVSLALDGDGLGTVWGTETALRMLGEAGFGSVDVEDRDRPVQLLLRRPPVAIGPYRVLVTWARPTSSGRR
jgi:hypothetical protein